MSTIVARNIAIAGISTSVPEVISKVAFPPFSEVNVRRSVFEQTSSDLALDAAKRLLSVKDIDLSEIGVLLFISRTPDYRSPNTAAILQGRLGLSIDCICYDVNRGSNGFQSGITIGASILNSINKHYGLIVIGDTPSKLHHEGTFFSSIDSDSGTAILLEKSDRNDLEIVSSHQSFGDHFKDFAIPKGGFREFSLTKSFDSTLPENFSLTFKKANIQELLEMNFEKFRHQMNKFISANTLEIDHSQLTLLGFSSPKASSDFVVKEFGNTYSSNIPLQLEFYSKKLGSEELRNISCFGWGEGLEFSFIRFSIGLSDILSTNVSNDYFDEYRVSHEM